MKVDLETITNARAQSFRAIATHAENIKKRIVDSENSQKAAAQQYDTSVVDAWVKHVAENSYRQGEASGYAIACSHMTVSIDQLLQEVQAQYSALEEAVKNLQSVENLLDEDGSKKAPLD